MVMNDLEKSVASTFELIRQAKLAHLMMVPVPMHPTGVTVSGRMTYSPSGTAPFDVIGYTLAGGVVIGAELKQSQRMPSLSIIGPGKKGSGVQAHQLDALGELAKAGGIARLVWSNDGEVGILDNAGIISAHERATSAWASEAAGNTPPLGAKSISWSLFKPIGHVQLAGVGVMLDWLQL